mmetsp:Transcript_3016/g.8894  ORF Transcript_3016/g.8894 Transcript_3016/m.8894 type:complete len:307 (+) Transcript_3016:4427-5347(+)
MVHNGAAVPKRAHAAEPSGVAALPRRRELRLVQDADALDRGSHVRVEHAELCVGRRLIGHQLQPEAKKPRGTGSRFGMARVGLDAAHCRDGTVPCKQGRGERAHLDRVAERRASAVRLDAAQIIAGRSGIDERCLKERLLRLAVWRGEARALAVLPHAAPGGDEGRLRLGVRQQCEGTAGLATRKAISAGVKSVAAPPRRRHASRRKACPQRRQKHQAHASNNSARALAELGSTQCRVTSRKRRGAGSVIRRARTLEAQNVGQPSRCDRVAATRGRVDAASEGRVRDEECKVLRSNTNEHAHGCAN